MSRVYNENKVREPEVIYLAKPGRKLLYALNGVDPNSVMLTRNLNNTDELEFEVNRYYFRDESNGYGDIDINMLLFVEDTWFKINKPPVIEVDNEREYKRVTAESQEVELMQYSLVGFRVNTGDVDSYEMQYKTDMDNVTGISDTFYTVRFYDEENPKLSLLDLILKHGNITGWTVGYIDDKTLSESSSSAGERFFLKDETSRFDVDTQDVYSFLTRDVAKAFSCIFIFDTVNKTINAYREGTLGKNTNIILGFQNLQNSLTLETDREFYTVFNVAGDEDMDIGYANIGSSKITDISYFLNKKKNFLSEDLIDKYNAWSDYRESHRDEYKTLSIRYQELLDIKSDLEDRVPSDAVNNNWRSFEQDELIEALENYQMIIKGLEAKYVDEDNNFDFEALKKSVDYDLYIQITQYIIPEIIAVMQSKDINTVVYGFGNLFTNVNPVITYNWDSANELATVDVTEDSPCDGAIRAIKINGSGKVTQSLTGLAAAYKYVLSAYVKCTSGNGTVQLMYQHGTENTVASNPISIGNGWTRVSKEFTLGETAYTFGYIFGEGTYLLAGMQVEKDALHDFGYYAGVTSDNSLDAFESNWKLYGTVELSNKLTAYKNAIKSLTDSGFNKKPSQSEQNDWSYENRMYQKYLDYVALQDECQKALDERNAELAPIKTELTDNEDKRIKITEDVDQSNFGNVQSVFEPFTEEELCTLNELYIETDYVNENILIINTFSASEKVDAQEKLYQAAKEQLYLESHPQYTYTDSVDNLYAIPEFREFHDDLEIGNFLYVGTDLDTFVKLRVIGLTYNPCSWDNNLTIDFSTMLTYPNKMSDFAELIDNAISSKKNQIAGTANSNDVTTYTLTADVIKALLKNPIFSGYMDSITAGSANINTITSEKVITALIKAGEGEFDKLTAETAFIKYIESTLISADKIVTTILNADKATIEELTAVLIDASQVNADLALIKDLLAGNVAAGSGQFINLTADNVKIADAVIKDIIAARISVADLLAGIITLTDQMKIVSENGKMVMDGKVLQIMGTDSKGNDYVGVQLGYDTNDIPSLILRNEEGSIIMSPSGITQDGIADGLIHTNHIGLGQVTPDRLSYKVEVDSEGNQITNITRIYDGSGNNFGVDYTEFKESVNGNFNKVEDDIAALQNMAGTITLSGQQVFMEQNNTVTPDSITITATCKQGIVPDKWYINDTENTSYVAADKLSITIPSSFMADKLTATVKAVNTEKNVYDVFTLYKIRHGKDGNEGKTNYIHIMYSDYPEPTDVSQMTTVPSDYIGIYWDFYPINSQNPADYEWTRFKGEEGQSIKGDPGEDGKSTYIHVRYSNDGGKTFTGNNGKDAGDWIGTYTDYVKEDSDSTAMYTWLKAKGDQGIPGENGYTVILSNEVQVINTTEDYVPMSPTTYECSLIIYCGLDLLTPVMGEPKEGEFRVSLPTAPKGMQLKQTTAGTIIFTTGSSAINADGTIDLDIEVYGLEGHLRKSISYSASPRGQQGERGEGGLSVVLGNEFEGIMCDSTGKVLYDAQIDIPFYGYSGAKRVGCIAKTVQLGNGFTLLSNTASTSNIAGNIKLGVTAGVVLSEVSGVINCTFSIEATEVTKAFTWMQQTPGAEGQAARIYILESDSLIIKKSDGNVFTPSSISFSGYYRDGLETERHEYPGRFKIEEYAASAWTEKYLSSADETSKTWTPSAENVEFIKCSLCDSLGNILDMQTVTVIIEAPDISDELTEIKETISNISSTVDKQAMEIKDKISLTEMINVKDAEGNIVSSSTLNDILVESKTSLDGFSNTVSNLKTEIGDKNNPADGTLYSAVTEAKQLANKFSWIVKEGSSESSMELTPNFVKIVSNRITYDGVVEVLNTGVDAGVTRINGGVIETNSLNASAIKTDTLNALLVTANAIKSATYEDSTDTKSPYSKTGMWVQLDGTGAIKSRNFAIDKDGNAYFKGEIHALTGELGSLTVTGTLKGGIIEGSKVQSTSYVAGSGGSYSKTSTGMIVDLDKGYIATPYLYTDSNGKLHATGGDFEGNVTTNYIVANGGILGGFNIGSTSLWNGASTLNSTTDGVYVGIDGINLGGGYFKVTKAGTLTARSATITGDITATNLTATNTGKIACWNINSSAIYSGGGYNTSGGKYFGTSGLSIGTSFVVNSSGAMTASGVDITGNITATSITANRSYNMYYSSELNSAPIINAGQWDDGNKRLEMGIYGRLGMSTYGFMPKIEFWQYGNQVHIAGNLYLNGELMRTDYALSSHTHSQFNDYVTKSTFNNKTYNALWNSNDIGVKITSGNIFKPCDTEAGDEDNLDNVVACGRTASRWTRVYAANATIGTSDIHEKENIKDIDERYEKMFMELHPVNYMWKQIYDYDAHHDRIHCGLIAQEVNEAAEKYGLSKETFATICRDDLDNPLPDGRTERWGLAYSELHGLEIHMIQKNAKQIENLKNQLNISYDRIENLLSQLETLENSLNDILN